MAITPARVGKLRLKAGRLAYVAATVPHSPNPPHQSLAGPLAVSWQCTPALFEVYIGTTTTPPLVGTTRSLGWALPPLAVGTTYYWRVVASNDLGPPAAGPLWSFTAAVPVAPVLVFPPHHSTNQPPSLTLAWTQPATVPGDIVFDVYFGPTPSPPIAQRRQTATTYTPGLLRDGVDYYWRVVAINNVGATSGPIWTFETRNPTTGLITIGGVDVRARVRVAGISVRDILTDTPNTCQFTIEGAAPAVGAEVRVGLASLAADDVLFGGYIDTVESVYEGLPVNRAWRVTCQDYVYGINRRKIRRRYGQQSATAIGIDLVTRDAPAGYSSALIQQGLPVVTGGIDFTEEDLTACFARLAQRIGGYWYVDYDKVVHLFLVESVDAPTVVTGDARVLLDDPPVNWTADLTQIRTRNWVEGGGSEARAGVLVGATSLPVTDASWYSPTGGLVVSGPQRIRYAGKGAVGGPAAPTATGQAIVGALGGGPYSYVVTQMTAGAESPLSPPSPPVTLAGVAAPTVPVTATPVENVVIPPATAVVVAPVSTEVPAPVASILATPISTEVPPPPPLQSTAVSTHVPPPPTTPAVAPVDTGVGAPGSGPSAAAAFTGVANPLGGMFATASATPGNMAPGNYQWDVTFVTAQGETVGQANATLLQLVPGSTSVQLSVVATSPDGRVTKRNLYRVKQGTSTRHFLASLNDNVTTTYVDTFSDAQLGAPNFMTGNTTGTGGLVVGSEYEWAVTFGTSGGETLRGPAGPRLTIPSGFDAATLSGIPTSGDGRTTKRLLYRARAGGGAFQLEATINDNVTTTYTSTKPDAQLGATPPGLDTTGPGGLVPGVPYAWAVTFVTAQGETPIGPWTGYIVLPPTADTAQLSAVPIGADPRVTRRRIYRYQSGDGQWRRDGELADNTTTAYTSNKTLAQLGVIAPTSNTTGTGGLVPGQTYYWAVSYGTAVDETTIGNYVGVSLPAGHDTAQLSSIAISGDPRVTRRKLYRTKAGGGAFFLLATLADNTTTTYLDTKTDASLGAVSPPVNTTGTGGLVPGAYYSWAVAFVTSGGVTPVGPPGPAPLPPGNLFVPSNCDTVAVAGIPTSPDARVIARRLYRTSANVGGYYLEATINDNTTTTYTSNKTDASLGAVAPAANTTGTGDLLGGAFYSWVVTFVTTSGETIPGVPGPLPLPPGNIQLPANCDTATISNIPISNDPRVTRRRLYRTGANVGGYRFEVELTNNTATTYTSVKADGALGDLAPTVNTTGTGGLLPGHYYSWRVRYVTASGESATGPPGPAPVPPGNLLLPAGYDMVQLSNIPVSPDARVTKRRIFRTLADTGTYRFEVELADNTTTSYTSVKTDAQLGADLVDGNTTSAGGQIAVANIATGGGTTTARKLYRTESGGASYLLVVTIEDNTTTTYQDNKSDASLGAFAPVDAVTELIGIPASGDGAILYEIRLGDEVNILVQCDDVAAQAALAALEGAGSTGIVEHFISDRRLGLTQASATGFADLKLFARPLVTVRYATRDPKTRSGKTVSIRLPELSLEGEFTIQTVAIDEIDRAPGLFPRYTVTASSIRFSLEDVLRRLQLAP